VAFFDCLFVDLADADLAGVALADADFRLIVVSCHAQW
jgi:hypothetical protein